MIFSGVSVASSMIRTCAPLFTNRHLVKFSTSDIEFPIPQDQPQRIRSTTSVKSVFRPGNINFPCFYHGRRVKYNDLVIVRSGCISFRGRNESDRSTHRSSRRHFQTSFHFQSSIILPGYFTIVPSEVPGT